MICRLLASFSSDYRTQSGITEWFRRIVTFKAGSEGVGVSREAAVHIKNVEEQIGGKKAVEGGNSWVLYCYDLATDNTDNKQTRSWKGKALYTFYILVRVAGLLLAKPKGFRNDRYIWRDEGGGQGDVERPLCKEQMAVDVASKQMSPLYRLLALYSLLISILNNIIYINILKAGIIWILKKF